MSTTLTLLKEKQNEFITKTKEYSESLKELCKEVSSRSAIAKNEASIATIFELSVYSFIHEIFHLKIYPVKELAVQTERHIKKGRIDSKVGAFVIEYKHFSKLKTIEQRHSASSQLTNYLLALSKQSNSEYIGLITDGLNCQYITVGNNEVRSVSSYDKLGDYHLRELVKNYVTADQVALTPENLVNDFCNPPKASIANKLTKELFYTLSTASTHRSSMLFKEWKELFKLAHDDISKQKAIEERKEALAKIIDTPIKSVDEEYLALYALQTTYAIIVKVIAYKVISKIQFKRSLIQFNEFTEVKFETLRKQLDELEQGAIFRDMGIGNLLEGDFFAWYCTDTQWNDSIGAIIQEIFQVLSKYEDKALFENGENVQDLFKDLFMQIIPDKVRHSLGEFYTPLWLADNLITEAIENVNDKENWTALDPCAGSGTFLTVLIKKVLEATVGKPNEIRLSAVLNRVKGVDLNPLAVLTARINYFINISPLIEIGDEFEIPVYLGDSSYVPEQHIIDDVNCVSYKIRTIKGDINISIPCSAISDTAIFSKTMTAIEDDIVNQDIEAISNKLFDIIKPSDLTPTIREHISLLSERFVELERNDWNGIWARIVTNFLTTANLGKFTLIVGNPPWIDWKNLPAGYRDRIKALCLKRHLFSGDSITGGINLNICALIANVAAQNWLKEDGMLAFLMPQSLVFQQSYEGFRNFTLNDNKRLYFKKIYDWTKSGHPFKPVQEKFLSYFMSHVPSNYFSGIPLTFYHKKAKYNLQDYNNVKSFDQVKDIFDTEHIILGQANISNTGFSYAADKNELDKFKAISGESTYIGREGIEFYPQEVFLLEVENSIPQTTELIGLKNFQNHKSKYKIPQSPVLLEKAYLHPLIKGVDINRFHLNESNYLVPFPYDESNVRAPIEFVKLSKQAKHLTKYFNKHKEVLQSQTHYNEKIMGAKNSKEFYALARVGEYSFAQNYVAFRDNSKWQSCVVSAVTTPWGEYKRPLFQNHAVSISQNSNGDFITLDEAHYICAILNAPISAKFLLKSSDSRSFKIRVPINIPTYDTSNVIHLELCAISKTAH
ncbi:MAG: hypothetical protein EOO43_03070, partial [Flavobacterium sp.]